MFPVQLYTDSIKAAVNQRLAIITFKDMPVKDDKGNKILDEKGEPKMKGKHANRCVSIPIIPAAAGCVDILRDVFTDKFQDLQDSVIKSIIMEALNAGTTGADGKVRTITISEEQISMEACAKFHAATSTGKLSKEVLTKWFDSDLADTLTLKLSEQMQLPAEPSKEQLSALEAGVAEFKGLYATMAAPKIHFADTIAKQLRYGLKLATDSRIKTTLAEKLATMLQSKAVALSIGFANMEDEEESEQEQQ